MLERLECMCEKVMIYIGDVRIRKGGMRRYMCVCVLCVREREVGGTRCEEKYEVSWGGTFLFKTIVARTFL